MEKGRGVASACAVAAAVAGETRVRRGARGVAEANLFHGGRAPPCPPCKWWLRKNVWRRPHEMEAQQALSSRPGCPKSWEIPSVIPNLCLSLSSSRATGAHSES